jgi:hypothetical protein
MTMSMPVTIEVIGKTEESMGVSFPAAFKLKMSQYNGGHVDLSGESWFLLPFEDLSSRSSIRKTAQNIRVETQAAIEAGLGFPVEGVAIAHNGAGDLLFLKRDGAVMSPEVWTFRLRGGEITKTLDDVAELWDR